MTHDHPSCSHDGVHVVPATIVGVELVHIVFVEGCPLLFARDPRVAQLIREHGIVPVPDTVEGLG